MSNESKRKSLKTGTESRVLEKLKKFLSLDHYDISVEWDCSGDDDEYGSILMSDGGMSATISLSSENIQTERELVETIIHEICHLLMYNVTNAVDDLRDSGVFTDREWRIVASAVSGSIERDVARMEKIFKKILDMDELKGYI